MHWLKRGLWNVGAIITLLLFLLILLMGISVSTTNAHESVSRVALSGTITVQTTPTEDATMTALQKEKLTQEVRQLKDQNEPDLFGWVQTNTVLLSTLIVVLGGLIGLFRWVADRRSERGKRAEERLQTAVAGLGDDKEGARINAAILLRNFLHPGYERFSLQILELAIANLCQLRTSALPEELTTPLLLTPLRQALIVVFKEAFPLARKQNKGGPQSLDATDIQLDNAYLEKADLKQAWMQRAFLRNAHLMRADLSGSHLREANLSDANLSNANLRGADLSGANLRGADLLHTCLAGANLNGANLSSAHLMLADLSEADLSGATLEYAKLFCANLSGANLNGACLAKADLREADLSQADLRGVYLSEATLGQAKLYRANLSEAYLSRADFGAVDLTQANLRASNLSDTNLSGADLSGARLRDANLRGADLHGATLTRNVRVSLPSSGERLHLRSADLSGTDLRDADLSDADLSGANLWEADLSGADLSRATLKGAKLNGAMFGGADLSGADLSGAYLSGAFFSDANLERAKICELYLWFLEQNTAELVKCRQTDPRWTRLSDADLQWIADRQADHRWVENCTEYLRWATTSAANLEDAHLLKEADLRGVKGLTQEQREACEAKGALHCMSQEQREKKEPPPLALHNLDMGTILEQLTKSTPVPTLPNADQDLPSPPHPEGFLGPKRTFGVLHHPLDVWYASEEYTVKYVQRSRYILYRNLFFPALMLLLQLSCSIVVPRTFSLPLSLPVYWWVGSGVVILSLLAGMGLIYRNYVGDVYVLSNRHIIDVKYKLAAEYMTIRDVRVIIPSILERFLDVGNVCLETSSNLPYIILCNVDHPLLLQYEIQGIKSYKKKEEKRKREIDEKKCIHQWFATVFTKLEEMTQCKRVPDLCGKDVQVARSDAQKLGLDIAVWGAAESSSTPSSGDVIHQNPPPGTLIERGSSIEVVLSKRPAQVEHMRL